MSRERSPGQERHVNALNTVVRTVRVVYQGKMGECSHELTQTALIFIPKLAGKCKPNSNPGAKEPDSPVANYAGLMVHRFGNANSPDVGCDV